MSRKRGKRAPATVSCAPREASPYGFEIVLALRATHSTADAPALMLLASSRQCSTLVSLLGLDQL